MRSTEDQVPLPLGKYGASKEPSSRHANISILPGRLNKIKSGAEATTRSTGGVRVDRWHGIICGAVGERIRKLCRAKRMVPPIRSLRKFLHGSFAIVAR